MPLFGDVLVIGHWCLSDLVLPGDTSTPFQDSCWVDGQTPHDGFYRGGDVISNVLNPAKVDGHVDIELLGGLVGTKQAVAAGKCCPGLGTANGVRTKFDGDPIFTEVIFSVGAVEPAHNNCIVPVGAVPWWDETDFSFGIWAYGNSSPVTVWPGTFQERTFNGGSIADATFAVHGDGVPVGWGIISDGDLVAVAYNSETTGASFSLDCGELGLSSSEWNFYSFSADTHGVRAYRNGLRTDQTGRGMFIGGDQLTFGNRNASGGGDINQMASTFNGAFGGPIMLSRALSDDEWARFFEQGCGPVARIKKRFRIKVTNDVRLPTNTVNNTPGGGLQPGGVKHYTAGGFSSVPIPPTGYTWPNYQLANWGASLFRAAKFGAGCGAFGVQAWPSGVWTPVSFDTSRVIDPINLVVNPPLGEISMQWFFKSGDKYVRYGWNSPEISVPTEHEEWSGPVGAVDTSTGWGLTGFTPSFPHWIVSTGDPAYQMLIIDNIDPLTGVVLFRAVPPWSTDNDGIIAHITGPTVIDGATYDEHMLFDTGVMDPDYFRSNYPLTYNDADMTFNTYANEWPARNNSFYPTRTSRGYLLAGQLLFPSKDYWGFGIDWSGFQKKTFKARVRETVTDTVISQDSRSGNEMGFFETPNLDLLMGRVTYGLTGVLGGGGEQFSLAPWGHAKIPAGRSFVVEIWQNTGTELTVPIWGNMALTSHYGGGEEGPFTDTSEDDWPTLP